MATVMIADFSGMMPLRDPILLPDVNAQYAENAWMYEGAVRGFRQENSVYDIKYADTQQVYRIPITAANPPDFSSVGSIWMEFPDPYMSAIRNPTVGDQYDRYYFFPSTSYDSTGDNPVWPTTNPGPVYSTLTGISQGQQFMKLGIPTPTTAPTVTTVATSITYTATSASPKGSTIINLNSVAGLTTGMYAADITSTSSNLVASAATAPNGTLLTFGSTGVFNGSAGASVVNLTTTTVTANTTQSTATGSAVLNFSSTTGILPGMTAVNNTTLYSISAGTNVSSVTPTTVTLEYAATSTVNAGDQIQFTNPSTNIPSGTVVTGSNATQLVISNPVGNAGILVGDTINVQSSNAIQTDTTVEAIGASTVTLSAAVVSGGVLAGDLIQFSVEVAESRAYLYTMVSAYGEEGPPSTPTVLNGSSTGTWTITIPAPPAGINTGRDLVYYRIYRTVTDASGNATYYQVGQVPINFAGTVTFNDAALDANITANQQLPSINYAEPPSDLQGVVMMANGIAAGWSNQREIWFSEQYLPHAWPAVYALTVDYPVVGLTANGSSLNIMTEGCPFIATGTTPDTMTIGKITANEPCIGRSSIVAAGEGAYYASPNGYILLNTGGTTNMTQQAGSGTFEKEFWYQLTPWNLVGGRYANALTAFIKGQGVPTIDPTNEGLINGFVIDQTDTNVPFTYIDTNTPVLNAMTDELSGQLFYITEDQVYQWNPPNGGVLWPWVWRSKKFRFTFAQQFKAFMVLFDIPPEVTFTPGVRNTSQTQVYDPETQYLICRVFGDGEQLVVREIQQSGETLLIPNGSKWTQFEFQFEGIIRLKFFKSATSVKELKAA